MVETLKRVHEKEQGGRLHVLLFSSPLSCAPCSVPADRSALTCWKPAFADSDIARLAEGLEPLHDVAGGLEADKRSLGEGSSDDEREEAAALTDADLERLVCDVPEDCTCRPHSRILAYVWESELFW